MWFHNLLLLSLAPFWTVALQNDLHLSMTPEELGHFFGSADQDKVSHVEYELVEIVQDAGDVSKRSGTYVIDSLDLRT